MFFFLLLHQNNFLPPNQIPFFNPPSPPLPPSIYAPASAPAPAIEAKKRMCVRPVEGEGPGAGERGMKPRRKKESI